MVRKAPGCHLLERSPDARRAGATCCFCAVQCVKLKVLLYGRCRLGQIGRGTRLLWCSNKEGRLNRCNPVLLLSSVSLEQREKTYLGIVNVVVDIFQLWVSAAHCDRIKDNQNLRELNTKLSFEFPDL